MITPQLVIWESQRPSRKLEAGFTGPDSEEILKTGAELVIGCASRKRLPKPHCAPLQSDRVGVPLQHVAMDILGPLPVSEKGYKYILVISDYFTKWTEAYPMPNMEASTIASLFVHDLHLLLVMMAYRTSVQESTHPL